MNDHFKDVEKLRSRAELHKPENALKGKVGAGGFAKPTVDRAQQTMDTYKADIKPVIGRMIGLVTDALGEAKAGRLKGEAAIETVMAPVMQIEGHGQMFDFPQFSKISHIFMDFLETVPEIDDDVFDIASAYVVAIATLMAAPQDARAAKDLCDGLLGACNRYHKKQN